MDDVLRHRSHDIFWCFRHERKVSSYVNVKTNKKENEFTYAAYHVRTSYTFLYKQKQVDLNLLFPLQRAIHILHQNLMNSSHRHGVEGMTPSLRLFSFFFCNFVSNPGRALIHVFNNPYAMEGYLWGSLSKKLEFFTPYEYK